MSKISFLSPFRTAVYDDLFQSTLSSHARHDTEIVVSNLEAYPTNMEEEDAICAHVVKSEQLGFDAVIVGCCYDPGVRKARELVNIPVVGPLEAALQMYSYFGNSTAVVTDEKDAIPYIKDLVKLYEYQTHCESVTSIDWLSTDIVKDPLSTAYDAYVESKKIMTDYKVNSVILGCTIISASVDFAINNGKSEYLSYPIINCNSMAIKMAESLANLQAMGRFNKNRLDQYAPPSNLKKYVN